MFAAKPLVWIGLHSYGMYLWHYPILLLMNPRSNIDGTPWWMYLVELAVIFAISWFSYKFVEDPIRHGAIGKFVGDVRSGQILLADWLRTHAPAHCGGLRAHHRLHRRLIFGARYLRS